MPAVLKSGSLNLLEPSGSVMGLLFVCAWKLLTLEVAFVVCVQEMIGLNVQSTAGIATA